jgi:hypothetical protein
MDRSEPRASMVVSSTRDGSLPISLDLATASLGIETGAKKTLPARVLLSMPDGISVPVSCCGCGRRSCRRSPLKTFWEEVLSVLGWYPWRCAVSKARFFLRRKLNDPYAILGPTDKRDSSGGEGQSSDKKIA